MRILLSVLFAVTVLAPATPASAEVLENSVLLPYSMSVLSCSGEEVQMTGNLHLIYSVIDNGDSLYLRYHSQLQGVSGTGATGQYHASGVTKDVMDASNASFPFSYTSVYNLRIIGQGPGNNFLVHTVAHVTIGADGEVSADVTSSQAECR